MFNPRNSRIFYGWIITAAVFASLGIAYGSQYSFGVVFPFLVNEFEGKRETVSGAFALYVFMYSVLALVWGRWSDRFGPRPVLICGSVCLGAGIALISWTRSPWHLYVSYGLLASWGMGAAYITAAPTVVKWFVAKRGLALGIAQCGQGVGIILIPLLTGVLIASFGWRHAYLVLGVIVAAILCTAALFLSSHPEKIGLQPYGSADQATREAVSLADSWSAGEAIRTGSFWLITIIFSCAWLFIFFPLVHLVIFATDIGLSRAAALTSLTLLGAFSILGRLGTGIISDRIGRKMTLAGCIGLQIFSWIWIMGTDRTWMVILFSLAFGISYGGISVLFSAMIGDYFGRLNVSAIIGFSFAIGSSSSAVGPWIAGYIHDVTGSYQLVFRLGLLANIAALSLVFFSRSPRRRPLHQKLNGTSA